MCSFSTFRIYNYLHTDQSLRIHHHLVIECSPFSEYCAYRTILQAHGCWVELPMIGILPCRAFSWAYHNNNSSDVGNKKPTHTHTLPNTCSTHGNSKRKSNEVSTHFPTQFPYTETPNGFEQVTNQNNVRVVVSNFRLKTCVWVFSVSHGFHVQ
jgi:hypothetical protein